MNRETWGDGQYGPGGRREDGVGGARHSVDRALAGSEIDIETSRSRLFVLPKTVMAIASEPFRTASATRCGSDYYLGHDDAPGLCSH